MRVFVNEEPYDLAPGMTVRHALLRAGIPVDPDRPVRIQDEWGNELGLGGELTDGDRVFVADRVGQR